MSYENPVLKGFYPDPSVCRAGEDYYLVASSFEFFPGVPLFHSKNLVNWRQIGHCLNTDSALNLRGCRASGGIYAPTIRYHGGEFFMITTNVGGGGHLIVHSKDMEKGWSDPVWVDHPGIDPSLLFDGGKVYFTSTGRHEGREAIFMFEIDPFTGKKLTLPVCVSRGCGGRYPEAPHVYHIGDYYYLLLAEGGTEYGHMVTIQRSVAPYGPYEPCPHNPILSHRDRMYCNIHATGHGDLFEDANGNWWMVCLGIRQLPGAMLHNLGRETFLAPVVWRDGWPVVGNGGQIDCEMDGPLPSPAVEYNIDFKDDFSGENPDLRWTFVRNPKPGLLRFEDNRLILSEADSLSLKGGSPAFIGTRQQEFKIIAEAVLETEYFINAMAGVSAFYNSGYHYDLCVEEKNGELIAFLRTCLHDMEYLSGIVCLPRATRLLLRIEADEEEYAFSCGVPGEDMLFVGKGATAGLCAEGTRTMTFTGVFTGMFCERGKAAFSSFEVKSKVI